MSNILLFGANFISNWIMTAIYQLFLGLDSFLYSLVGFVYRVFLLVANAKLFGDDTLGLITNRIYTVLGIAMLFVFAYNLLLLIANPDNLTSKDDKSIGSMAKNLIISLILLTLLPTIFHYLQVFQSNVLSSSVISNVVLGTSSTTNTNLTRQQEGTNAALSIFQAFYHPKVDDNPVSREDCEKLLEQGENDNLCDQYIFSLDTTLIHGNFSILTQNSDLYDGITGGKMEYMWILSSAAAVIAGYFFISFALDLGIRAAKLAFLQLIAPLPITMRIFQPKGGMFDRWKNDFVETYGALFIRLLVIYFSMFAITLVPEVMTSLWQDGNETGGTGVLVKLIGNVILIFGILKFAKDAPKMIEELFKLKNVEIGIRKKLGDNEYGMRGISALGSGAGSFYNNFKNNYKDDAGNKHFGKALFSGASGVARGATRGWQNGNVKDFSQMGGAINKARTEASAGVTNFNQNAGEFLDDPRKKFKKEVKDRYGTAKDWLGGTSATSENLTAANQISSRFKNLFTSNNDNLEAINKAEADHTRDFHKNGEKLTIKRADGSIALNAKKIEQVVDYYKRIKRETYLKNFKDEMPTLNALQKDFSTRLDENFNKLTAESQKVIMESVNNTVNKIDTNDQRIDGAKNYTLTDIREILGKDSSQLKEADIAALMKFQSATDSQIDIYRNRIEEKKDK